MLWFIRTELLVRGLETLPVLTEIILGSAAENTVPS
jgi:hypothetical protein